MSRRRESSRVKGQRTEEAGGGGGGTAERGTLSLYKANSATGPAGRRETHKGLVGMGDGVSRNCSGRARKLKGGHE